VVVSGTSTAGAQVVLWRKLAHQSSFQQAGQTSTDSAGRYTFTLPRGTVMADQEWYVSSNGQQSATIEQHVEALVGLSSSARSTAAGQAVVLHGHVTPSHAGQVVLVEMSRAGTWHVIARARLGHGSSYAVSHRFARSGTFQIRVVLRADSRNDLSTSRTVKITVKG
jgi:hypothetical protein